MGCIFVRGVDPECREDMHCAAALTSTRLQALTCIHTSARAFQVRIRKRQFFLPVIFSNRVTSLVSRRFGSSSPIAFKVRGVVAVARLRAAASILLRVRLKVAHLTYSQVTQLLPHYYTERASRHGDISLQSAQLSHSRD